MTEQGGYKKLNQLTNFEYIQDAFFRGEAVASAYQPGDLFLGAYGELERIDIAGANARAAFITGYLQALPRPIVTNNKGEILSVGKK
jgi:hypothetical protein